MYPTSGNATTSPATSTSAGSVVRLSLQLLDRYGNEAIAPEGVSVQLTGAVSRTSIVDGTQFTAVGAGLYQHLYTMEAQETLAVSLRIGNITVSTTQITVTSVSPDAVVWGASLASSAVLLYGSALSQGLSAGTTVRGLAAVVHRIVVPVVRPNGVPYGADPGLLTNAKLVLPAAAGSGLNATEYPAFNGSWSHANRSYVIYLLPPEVGRFTVTLTLAHPTVASAKVGNAGVHTRGAEVRLGTPWLIAPYR